MAGSVAARPLDDRSLRRWWLRRCRLRLPLLRRPHHALLLLRNLLRSLLPSLLLLDNRSLGRWCLRRRYLLLPLLRRPRRGSLLLRSLLPPVPIGY